MKKILFLLIFIGIICMLYAQSSFCHWPMDWGWHEDHLTSAFGPRAYSPYIYDFHRGLDIDADWFTYEVKSAIDGDVAYSRVVGGYNGYAIIAYLDPTSAYLYSATGYGHIRYPLNPPFDMTGSSIFEGEVFTEIPDPGATGSHLHFNLFHSDGWFYDEYGRLLGVYDIIPDDQEYNINPMGGWTPEYFNLDGFHYSNSSFMTISNIVVDDSKIEFDVSILGNELDHNEIVVEIDWRNSSGTRRDQYYFFGPYDLADWQPHVINFNKRHNVSTDKKVRGIIPDDIPRVNGKRIIPHPHIRPFDKEYTFVYYIHPSKRALWRTGCADVDIHVTDTHYGTTQKSAYYESGIGHPDPEGATPPIDPRMTIYRSFSEVFVRLMWKEPGYFPPLHPPIYYRIYRNPGYLDIPDYRAFGIRRDLFFDDWRVFDLFSTSYCYKITTFNGSQGEASEKVCTPTLSCPHVWLVDTAYQYLVNNILPQWVLENRNFDVIPIYIPTNVDSSVEHLLIQESDSIVDSIDCIKLLKIDHPHELLSAVDYDGNFFIMDTIDLLYPVTAYIDDTIDILELVSEKDGKYYSSDESGSMVLSFINSLHGELALFTTYAVVKASTPELKVEVLLDTGWTDIGYLPPRSLAYNEYVSFPVECGGDSIYFKLIWDKHYKTDYVGLYPNPTLITPVEIPLISAVHSSGDTVSGALLAPDSIYVQILCDEYVDLMFASIAAPDSGIIRDYYFLSYGHYEYDSGYGAMVGRGSGSAVLPMPAPFPDPDVITDQEGELPEEEHDYGKRTAEIDMIPKVTSLGEPKPNPFNATIDIPFDVSEVQIVRIAIYDISGKLIDVLTDKEYEVGRYHLVWDGSGRNSGTYFVKMTAGDYTNTKQIVLIK